MRNKFVLFFVISILLHLLLISVLNLRPDVKPKNQPIKVSLIPKKKPAPRPRPKPAPKPEPQHRPSKIIENTPLKEDLKTKVDQAAPAVPKQPEKQAKKQEEKTPKKGKPGKPIQEKTIHTITQDESKVEMPKVSPDNGLTKQQQKNILNPDDIIQKYAAGGPDETGTDSVSMQYVKLKYQSYFYKFARRLYRVWVYPEEAAYRRHYGVVHISFVIARDGSISGIKVTESSGYPELDNEAVRALRNTGGVPLPDSYKLNFLRVNASFKYVLGGGFSVY